MLFGEIKVQITKPLTLWYQATKLTTVKHLLFSAISQFRNSFDGKIDLEWSNFIYVKSIVITPISWKPEPTCIYSNNPNS